MDLSVPLTVLRGHTKPIVSISSINDFILSADEAGCLVVWKLEKDCEESKSASLEFITVAELKVKEPIFSVSTSFKTELDRQKNYLSIFLQLKSGKVKIYSFSLQNFDFNFVEDFEIGKFTFCRISTLLKYLAYPDEGVENAVNIIDLETNRTFLSSFLPTSVGAAAGMCLFTKLYPHPSHQDTKLLALFGYETGKIVMLDINLEGLNLFEIIFEGKVLEESCTDAEYNPETMSIVVVGAGKDIKVIQNVWDPAEMNELNIKIPFAGCNSVTIRSDGKLFVTAGWDAKIRFFSLKKGKPLAILEHHFDIINSLLINSDYCTFAASADGTISVWSLLK